MLTHAGLEEQNNLLRSVEECFIHLAICLFIYIYKYR